MLPSSAARAHLKLIVNRLSPRSSVGRGRARSQPRTCHNQWWAAGGGGAQGEEGRVEGLCVTPQLFRYVLWVTSTSSLLQNITLITSNARNVSPRLEEFCGGRPNPSLISAIPAHCFRGEITVICFYFPPAVSVLRLGSSEAGGGGGERKGLMRGNKGWGRLLCQSRWSVDSLFVRSKRNVSAANAAISKRQAAAAFLRGCFFYKYTVDSITEKVRVKQRLANKVLGSKHGQDSVPALCRRVLRIKIKISLILIIFPYVLKSLNKLNTLTHDECQSKIFYFSVHLVSRIIERASEGLVLALTANATFFLSQLYVKYTQ